LDIEIKPDDENKITDWNSLEPKTSPFDFLGNGLETDWTSNGRPVDKETKPDDNSKRTDGIPLEIKNSPFDFHWKSIGR
jgi:hypothetical protein